MAALIAANRVSRSSRIDLRNFSRRCLQVEAELDSGLKQDLYQGKNIFESPDERLAVFLL